MGRLEQMLKGIHIAKSELDVKNMFYYAKGIRKFQRELKISVSEFPQLGFMGELTNDEERDSNKEWAYPDVQKEIEEYELQKIIEDPNALYGERYSTTTE